MGNSPREWNDGSAVRLNRQDPYLRLQSVMIYVRDLEQSLGFYLDQLGFQLIFDARVQPGRRFVTVAPPDGNSFSLVSFDEVTHAVEAQRRALAERLDSERRAAQEIEIAKQVQARLFPQSQPPLKTSNMRAFACRPAKS